MSASWRCPSCKRSCHYEESCCSVCGCYPSSFAVNREDLYGPKVLAEPWYNHVLEIFKRE